MNKITHSTLPSSPPPSPKREKEKGRVTEVTTEVLASKSPTSPPLSDLDAAIQALQGRSDSYCSPFLLTSSERYHCEPAQTLIDNQLAHERNLKKVVDYLLNKVKSTDDIDWISPGEFRKFLSGAIEYRAKRALSKNASNDEPRFSQWRDTEEHPVLCPLNLARAYRRTGAQAFQFFKKHSLFTTLHHSMSDDNAYMLFLSNEEILCEKNPQDEYAKAQRKILELWNANPSQFWLCQLRSKKENDESSIRLGEYFITVYDQPFDHFRDEVDYLINWSPCSVSQMPQIEARLEKLFVDILSWDERDPLYLREMIGKFRYYMTFYHPTFRGSASMADILENLFYRVHGFNQLRFNVEFMADLEAIGAVTLEGFLPSYLKNAFLEDPTL